MFLLVQTMSSVRVMNLWFEYWGRTTQRLTLNVDREGRILLPEAGGLVVAGRTLGDAQQIIQKLLARQFKDITVDVTLGKLRSVRVYVVGDVKNPGAYDISSLSTALSALIAAGRLLRTQAPTACSNISAARTSSMKSISMS